MPFFDDAGPKPEEERSILWRSTALIGDQLERMIGLNLGWALQSVPLMLAWAVPSLSSWLKILLTSYTVFTILPATTTLFAVLNQTSEGIPISLDMVKESLREQFRTAFTKLLPLVSLFFWLVMAAILAGQNNLLLVDALARLAILFLGVVSLYWGSLIVNRPDLSAMKILARSLELFWRWPGKTMLTAVICIIALAIGIVSIGGMFLIIPVLIALVQTQLYRSIPLKR